MADEVVEIALRVVSALEELQISYVIGGSLASSVYGPYRATLDCDIVADLQERHVPLLVERLESEFYISVEVAADAVRRRSSFNLIHLRTSYKVDVFIPKQRAFDQTQLRRGKRWTLGADERRSAVFSSAEDTVLAKLEWYRLGGETSTRQWRDVQGILRVQGDRLDRSYMRDMAVHLGVEDLLERAEIESS